MLAEKKLCMGCGSCAVTCSRHCISMKIKKAFYTHILIIVNVYHVDCVRKPVLY